MRGVSGTELEGIQQAAKVRSQAQRAAAMEAGRAAVLDEACEKLGGRDRVLQL
jgi:hypothetical protein